MTIRNPVEWSWYRLRSTSLAVSATSEESAAGAVQRLPAVRRIGLQDLRDCLALGWDDFAQNRSDVIFVCVMYPLIGLLLARLASGYGVLPLVFPLASGFALVGPFAAVGLNEMSRRREQGGPVGWADALGVFSAAAIRSILVLGLLLMAIFLVWLVAAGLIYNATMGPGQPASAGQFLHDVFLTRGGWALIVLGCGVGFGFAVAVLAISVVSFPLLLDRRIGLEAAILTSVRAVAANPRTMAAWGLIVAGLLVVGALPLLLGLVVVMPVLGHATWHLYRRLVVAG